MIQTYINIIRDYKIALRNTGFFKFKLKEYYKHQIADYQYKLKKTY